MLPGVGQLWVLKRRRFRRINLRKGWRAVETELARCGDDERSIINGKAYRHYALCLFEPRYFSFGRHIPHLD